MKPIEDEPVKATEGEPVESGLHRSKRDNDTIALLIDMITS